MDFEDLWSLTNELTWWCLWIVGMAAKVYKSLGRVGVVGGGVAVPLMTERDPSILRSQ